MPATGTDGNPESEEHGRQAGELFESQGKDLRARALHNIFLSETYGLAQNDSN